MTEAGWQCLVGPEGAEPVPARAGSIVVFSSLTPHCTGPNRTDGVRKAYIVQLAPDGAVALAAGAPGALAAAGATPVRTRQDAPDRQYPILVGGAPVPR
jgi:ectoine hydroxylase-related dioxygenase (phytanoyl-CoA dioxygenase family)